MFHDGHEELDNVKFVPGHVVLAGHDELCGGYGIERVTLLELEVVVEAAAGSVIV